MIELPEASVLARQLRETIAGKTIDQVVVGSSPHKFAFFNGDPADYPASLLNRTLKEARAYGGMVELVLGERRLVLSDGINLRYHPEPSTLPAKHQLLLRFTDGSLLSASVVMYGMLWLFQEGSFINEYRQAALEKPSPLSAAFSLDYFRSLAAVPGSARLSLKALLATEQQIPGLGNGVLQDILWAAGCNPRRRTESLSEAELNYLYDSLQQTLQTMVNLGGRDSERDLHGVTGGYRTRMSTIHAAEGCPRCGSPIVREAYLGGSVYYCPRCQPK